MPRIIIRRGTKKREPSEQKTQEVCELCLKRPIAREYKGMKVCEKCYEKLQEE